MLILPAAGYRRPGCQHGDKDGTDQVTQPGLQQVHICPWLMVPAFTPKVAADMVCPVNSSRPAMIASVKADAKGRAHHQRAYR